MTLTGLFVPLITPFAADGTVARSALEALAHDMLQAGATGLVALGTTGEPAALSPAERRAVVDVIGGVCRDREAPLIVGAERAAELRRLRGAAATLVRVPPFLRPGEEGVLAYFDAVTAQCPVPVVAYHVPYRTGQPLGVDALRRLAGTPGIAGIKYATGGVDATAVAFLADPPPGCAVLGGDDVVIAPFLALGGHGAILASAHVATADFAELVAGWRTGDLTRARPLGYRLAVLSAALFAEPNPAVIKGVLHAQGRIPTPQVRLPLLAAHPASVTAALTAVAAPCAA